MFTHADLPVEVVGQIYAYQDASGGWVDAHVVCGVVEELGAGVALNVVAVVVAPSQLDVELVLLCCRIVHHISAEHMARVTPKGTFGH